MPQASAVNFDLKKIVSTLKVFIDLFDLLVLRMYQWFVVVCWGIFDVLPISMDTMIPNTNSALTLELRPLGRGYDGRGKGNYKMAVVPLCQLIVYGLCTYPGSLGTSAGAATTSCPWDSIIVEHLNTCQTMSDDIKGGWGLSSEFYEKTGRPRSD